MAHFEELAAQARMERSLARQRNGSDGSIGSDSSDGSDAKSDAKTDGKADAVGIPPGAQCRPWCAEACRALNGYVAYECGACTGEGAMRCHPSAAGFAEARMERSLAEEDVEAVGPWEISTSAEARQRQSNRRP